MEAGSNARKGASGRKSARAAAGGEPGGMNYKGHNIAVHEMGQLMPRRPHRLPREESTT